ncbi:MAG: succinate dehydrogenase, cytochrome b556 subunit [Abyssibacter sp.]|uniref:succinate dehydrogenase, cytochrome b556 subunit n=1 Tax=Abyssibacter sp. TaxID=2320200 RepID=UPI002E997BEC|nr:succinate dehydrogenase, cytochrome b556 subunit [Pseudomonadota bacterium]
MSESSRPLSPHLQVYKPQLTSMMSILHRGTGIALAVGTVMLAAWILSVAAGPDALDCFNAFAGSWFGQLLLLGWTFSIFYHLSNGIRHLFWDAGKGFEVETAYKSGYAVLASAVILTVIAVIVALT